MYRIINVKKGFYRLKHMYMNFQCWALQRVKFDSTLRMASRFVDALHTLRIRPTLLSDWSEIIAAAPPLADL